MKIKYLILFLFCSACSKGAQQEYENLKQGQDTLQFVRYGDFEVTLDTVRDFETLKENISLFYLLLLDSTKVNRHLKYNPEFIDEFNLHYHGIGLFSSTIGFNTSAMSIEGIFLSDTIKKRILNCIVREEEIEANSSKIDSPICIKENTAIFKVSNTSSQDVYYCHLSNGRVQINWLVGVIE